MNTKELQFGDYVLDRLTGRPVEVVAIGEHWARVRQSDGVTKDLPEEDIEPIPITPEILERNGFELLKRAGDCRISYVWKTGYGGRLMNEIEVMFDRNDKEFCFIFVSFRHRYTETIGKKEIHYLQHRIKECEITKQIAL